MSLIALKAAKTKRGPHSLTKTYGQIALFGELPIRELSATQLDAIKTKCGQHSLKKSVWQLLEPPKCLYKNVVLHDWESP